MAEDNDSTEDTDAEDIYNASDAESVGKNKQKTDNAQQQLEADWRKLLEQKWGRRLVWHWMCEAGLYTESFTGDNDQTNFQLGLKAAGRRMLTELNNADPKAYANLILEFGIGDENE